MEQRTDAEVLHLLLDEAEAAAHQERDDGDVHRVHRRLVAGAVDEHADAEVLLADHLLDDRARQRLGLRARLAGLAADEIERLLARPRRLGVLARAALLGGALAGGGVYYERIRKDPRLAAMLFGTAFLIGFSAAFSVLNY
nr:hypothetical protein [Caldimonas sp.]